MKEIQSRQEKGNVHNAIKLLTDNLENDILPQTEKALQQLKQQHPPRRNADSEVLLTDKPEEVNPFKFASIDAESVRKATFRTGGDAGPSGLEAEGWKRLFASTQFGDNTVDLCNTSAEVITKVCSSENLSLSLEAFLA